MADVAQITYTDHDGTATNIFCTSVGIRYIFDGLSVERQPGKVGITVDPIQQYREVSCSAIISGDALKALNDQLMDGTKVYDATDPKVLIYLDGNTSLTILCVITHFNADIMGHEKWAVNITFRERTL